MVNNSPDFGPVVGPAIEPQVATSFSVATLWPSCAGFKIQYPSLGVWVRLPSSVLLCDDPIVGAYVQKFTRQHPGLTISGWDGVSDALRQSHTRHRRVIEHIEKYWCPSILGEELMRVVSGLADSK